MLVIHNSHLKNLNENILNFNTPTQKLLAYTIKQAEDMIKQATFVSQPKKILLHLGTNDCDRLSAKIVIEKLAGLIDVLRSLCPNAQIYVNSIPQRRDKMSTVDEVNDLLINFERDLGCKVIDNSNIQRSMLIDPKHFNKTVFFLLLANIRFGMFDKRSQLLDTFVR